MSYPKMQEPKHEFKADSVTFVVPLDFPEFMNTHMLAIVEHKGGLQPMKYFISIEAYSAIMENFAL
jgi:hypothetical protein